MIEQSDAWVMEREGERFIGIHIRSGEFALALSEAQGLFERLHAALKRAHDPAELPAPEPRDVHVSEEEPSAQEVADTLAAFGLE